MIPRQPAKSGASIKPRVERLSAEPWVMFRSIHLAREVGDSHLGHVLSPAFAGLAGFR